MNTWNHTIFFCPTLDSTFDLLLSFHNQKTGASRRGIPSPRKASVSNCSFGTPDGVTRAGALMEAKTFEATAPEEPKHQPWVKKVRKQDLGVGRSLVPQCRSTPPKKKQHLCESVSEKKWQGFLYKRGYEDYGVNPCWLAKKGLVVEKGGSPMMLKRPRKKRHLA